jgi:formate hydrogenlyase subunit 3/multisubunit Na+/H+ antiporter MnhD subunit
MARLSSRTMQGVYLTLAVIGYLAPGVPMVVESARSGNVLFWTDPQRTIVELFANRTSTAFALDLVAVVVVALIFITREARRLGMARVWRFWVLTLLFGLGGTLPLFLYLRERRLQGQGGERSDA